jgi:type III secretion protein R
MADVSLLSGGLPINQVLSLVVLGALPLVFMATTSFLKVSVILSVLRSALGGGQIPSQSLSGILAVLVSLFTISPVIETMLLRSNSSNSNPMPIIKNQDKATTGVQKTATLIEKTNYIFEPLLEFMRLNTQTKERLYFYTLDKKRNKKINDIFQECEKVSVQEIKECLKANESLASLVISYVSSELRGACTLGVYIFVPFLVIDLVVSTLLTGLGMMMVSPVTITLPLKLLIFVMSDGWK